MQSLNQQIKIHWTEQATSQGVNEKIYDVVGGNGVLSGLDLSMKSGSVAIAPGSMLIGGCTVVENSELLIPLAELTSKNGAVTVDVVVSYVHGSGAVGTYSFVENYTPSMASCSLGKVYLQDKVVTGVLSSTKLKNIKALTSDMTELDTDLYQPTTTYEEIQEQSFWRNGLSGYEILGDTIINHLPGGVNHSLFVQGGLQDQRPILHISNNLGATLSGTRDLNGKVVVFYVSGSGGNYLRINGISVSSTAGFKTYAIPSSTTSIAFTYDNGSAKEIDIRYIGVFDAADVARITKSAMSTGETINSIPNILIQERNVNRITEPLIAAKIDFASSEVVLSPNDRCIGPFNVIPGEQLTIVGAIETPTWGFMSIGSQVIDCGLTASSNATVPANATKAIVHYSTSGVVGAYVHKVGEIVAAEPSRARHIISIDATDGLKRIGTTRDSFNFDSGKLIKRISNKVIPLESVLTATLTNTTQHTLRLKPRGGFLMEDLNLTKLVGARDTNKVIASLPIITTNEDTLGAIGKLFWSTDGTLKLITDKSTPIANISGIELIYELLQPEIYRVGSYCTADSGMALYSIGGGRLDYGVTYYGKMPGCALADGVLSAKGLNTKVPLTPVGEIYWLASGNSDNLVIPDAPDGAIVEVIGRENLMIPTLRLAKDTSTGGKIDRLENRMDGISLAIEDIYRKTDRAVEVATSNILSFSPQNFEVTLGSDASAIDMGVGYFKVESDLPFLFQGGTYRALGSDYYINSSGIIEKVSGTWKQGTVLSLLLLRGGKQFVSWDSVDGRVILNNTIEISRLEPSLRWQIENALQSSSLTTTPEPGKAPAYNGDSKLVGDITGAAATVGALAPADIATKTKSDLVYYVSTTGNDSNTGLSAGQALRNINTVFTKIPDIIEHNVIIYLSDGSYAEDVLIGGFAGQGSIQIIGNVGAKGNVSIRSYACNSPITVDLRGVTLSNTAGHCIVLNKVIRATIDANTSGTAASYDFAVLTGGSKARFSNCIVSNRRNAFSASEDSMITIKDATGSGNTKALVLVGAMASVLTTLPSATTKYDFTEGGGLIGDMQSTFDDIAFLMTRGYQRA